MPSSTSLVEAEEGESELPPPLVHAFAGMGLEEHQGSHTQTPDHTDESPPHHPHHYHFPSASSFDFLGAVLDLQPLHQRPSSGDEGAATGTEDEDPEAGAEAQAHAALHPQVETVLLYNGDDRDEAALGGGGGGGGGSMVLVPTGVYGEFGFEAEPTLLSRRKSVNTTECVAVPSSEHVAEIVGRQGEFLGCLGWEGPDGNGVWETQRGGGAGLLGRFC